MVPTPIQEKQATIEGAAIPTTVPVSASTTTGTTVQPSHVPLHNKNVLTKPNVLLRNYLIIMKGIPMSQLNVVLTSKCESGRNDIKEIVQATQAQPTIWK